MPGRGTVDPALWARRAEDPVPLRLELNGPKGRGWLMRWLPARAWENGVYVVFSNPIGLDGGEVRNGNSMVLDPYGEVLAECHALGDDVCLARCLASKLDLAGGRRYLRARRPSLYWPLAEEADEAPATLPGWQRTPPPDAPAADAPGDAAQHVGQRDGDGAAAAATAAAVAKSADPRVLRAAQTLYDFMSMRDEPPLAPADAILVLGSNDVRVAHCAATLHAQGLAPLVVFSGKQGRATEWLGSRTEADWLAEAAEAVGLPAAAIFKEPNATNTGENIRFCRELLSAHYGGHEIADGKRYIVVQKPFMLRRSWATFVRQWPGPAFQLASPRFPELAGYVDESIGMSLEVIVANMVGDAQRLLFYSEVKDFQAAVDVPARVWAAVGLLVGFGFTEMLCQR